MIKQLKFTLKMLIKVEKFLSFFKIGTALGKLNPKCYLQK